MTSSPMHRRNQILGMFSYSFKRSRWMFSVLAMATAFGAFACSSSDDRAPVVLVHGAWMGAWAWDDVAVELRARDEAVSVVELPAHGADQSPVADATLDAYVARVTASVDAAGAPVILVGHSMAGVVITEYAERNPDKVES